MIFHMNLKDVRRVQVRGQKVLLRVDYNIEVDQRGRVRDLTRIKATLPTIKWLLRHGAAIIIVSHRGRPKGVDPSLSLRPFVAVLNKLLKHPVAFSKDPINSRILRQKVAVMKPGQILMLENIRFYPAEENNTRSFAAALAKLGDLVVNDAFADSHRAHASIVGVAAFKPAYAGLLVQREIAELSRVMRPPRRPLVAVIGGAKISTKLGLVKKLLNRADYVLLGGALANTVLQAQGLAIGASVTEPKMLAAARGLAVTNIKLKIPCDVIVAKHRTAGGRAHVRAVGNIGPKEIILDIGPDTINLFGRVLAAAKTVIWNGPMGWYEVPPFDRGTKAIAKMIGRVKGLTIAGGGETIDAIRRVGADRRFSWLSTGGGAMLEYLEGRTLPGIKVVTK